MRLLVFAQLDDLLRERSPDRECVRDNGFCPGWIADNWERYVDPFIRHVELTLLAVGFGFVIAFALGLIAYRRRWLISPIAATTGVMYTLPSLSLFFILQPLTGRGILTATIALTAYTLLIIFRNVVVGLDGVPAEAKDAGRGMGFSERELLWRVEVPLALPEIVAGLRVATTTTVGLATLAFFAGAGGLGGEIEADKVFKSNVVTAGGLCVLLAVVLDVLLLGVQRALTPWSRARA